MSKKNIIKNLVEMDLESLSHEELINMVKGLRKNKGIGVKERVLSVLMSGDWIDNEELVVLSNGVSKGNVSSYCNYLRNDGFIILSDKNKRKLIGKIDKDGKKYKVESGELIEGEIVINY